MISIIFGTKFLVFNVYDYGSSNIIYFVNSITLSPLSSFINYVVFYFDN